MGRIAKYDWEALLDEYLRSRYLNKSDFAKAKGINPSLLRRNTTNWPEKSNVTQKRVTKKSNAKSNTKDNVTQKEKVPKIQLESPEGLNEKQSLFCLFYAMNPNATQAYLKAYQSNYEAAHVSGWRLLTNPRIREEIKRLKEQKREAIILDVEDLVEKHMRIAFSSLSDYVEFGRVEVPVMGPFGPVQIDDPATGEKVTLKKVVNDVRFRDSSEVDGGIISEVKVGRDGASIKLYDAQKSMDWLERYFEWNPRDKHKKWYDQEKLKLEQKALDKGVVTGKVVYFSGDGDLED